MNMLSELTLAALLTSTPSIGSAAECERVLQVGAWNIEWLGNAEKGGRNAQAPGDIASHIREAGVDVLALSEISATSHDARGRARNRQLDEALTVLNQQGARWEYRLSSKRENARAPQDQWTGIAWNAYKVSLLDAPWRLQASIDPAREEGLRQTLDQPTEGPLLWNRWPEAFRFSAGEGLSDFTLVPVHLKSNRGGRAATAQVRAHEVELLLAGLDAMPAHLRDDDIIVLGDSNMLSANEAGAALLHARGMKDCNARDLDTYISLRQGQSDAPFDRIFLAGGQPETAQSCMSEDRGMPALRFKVLQPEDWKAGITRAEFRERLSDHRMVKAGLCVLADDD